MLTLTRTLILTLIFTRTRTLTRTLTLTPTFTLTLALHSASRPHTNRLVQVGRRVAARASRDARRAQPPRAPGRLGGRRLLGELTSVLPSAAEPAACASGTAPHELVGPRADDLLGRLGSRSSAWVPHRSTAIRQLG